MKSQLATLEQQVKEMSAEIERLKQEEAEYCKPSILWSPEGQSYYYLTTLGATNGLSGEYALKREKRSQLFATKEEAEFADRQRIAKMKVLRRVAELNHKEGWVCDWGVEGRYNYYPYVYPNTNRMVVGNRNDYQYYTTDHYAAKSVWETVISEMEADVKLGLWGIE